MDSPQYHPQYFTATILDWQHLLNPVTAGICSYPEEYKYSSAKFYETGEDEFGITYTLGNLVLLLMQL